MKSLLKFIFFSSLVPILCVHHALLIIFIRDNEKRTKSLVKSLQSYCRVGLKILDIELVYDFDPELIRNRFIISNHLSYIDVLCFSALFPAAYITSVEMKETPILGQVCQLSGCIFTERRRRKRNAKTHGREIGHMTSYLKSGVNIVLFPESTTSIGETVLPFKTSLFESGIMTESYFHPLAIHYSSSNVPWYGDDISFIAHLWSLVQSNKIKAYITHGEPHQSQAGDDRKALGLRLHGLVLDLFSKCNFLRTSNE
jgi:1-acyl-sn-glycerol-3-phosphate acyltransferase